MKNLKRMYLFIIAIIYFLPSQFIFAEETSDLHAKDIDYKLNKFNTISTYGVLCHRLDSPYNSYGTEYATSGFEVGLGYFVFNKINFGLNCYNFNYHPASTYLTTIGGKLGYFHGNLKNKFLPNIYIEEGVALTSGLVSTSNMFKMGGGFVYKLHRNIGVSIAFEKMYRFVEGGDYIYTMYKVGMLGMLK